MRTFEQKPPAYTQVTTPTWVRPKRSHESISNADGAAIDRSLGLDLSRVPANCRATQADQQGPPVRPAHLQSNSPVAASALAAWLPQTCGTDAAAARVIPGSPVADEEKANAVTLGDTVHLSTAFPQLQPSEQQRVLAHEAVHVAQSRTPGPSADRERLEMEAHELGPQMIAGHRVQPSLHAAPATALRDDGGPLPGDRIAVRKAKARRDVLLRWKTMYEGSESQNLVTGRQKIQDQRAALDKSMQPRLDQAREMLGYGRDVKEYVEEEQKNVAALNKKPVTLEATSTDIRIKVRFQVKFEGLTDQEGRDQFPKLQKNLQQGIKDTWNQKLKGTLLPGRKLEVIPDISLVLRGTPRNDNFWLITVRPTDAGPMVYGTTKLGDSPQGRPTAVTGTQIDGGVMSIPPSVMTQPDILGHETLHLFGLADRYVTIPGHGEFGLRDTKGRDDPLGADEMGKPTGKILEEDLGFVLEELGLYSVLEKQEIYPTIPYKEVLLELRSVEEIIKTGRDPNSMIKKRGQFDDKMIKQAEDLD